MFYLTSMKLSVFVKWPVPSHKTESVKPCSSSEKKAIKTSHMCLHFLILFSLDKACS